jgi:hypothetical protein
VISRDAIANYKIVIEPDNTGWAMFTTWTFNLLWNVSLTKTFEINFE